MKKILVEGLSIHKLRFRSLNSPVIFVVASESRLLFTLTRENYLCALVGFRTSVHRTAVAIVIHMEVCSGWTVSKWSIDSFTEGAITSIAENIQKGIFASAELPCLRGTGLERRMVPLSHAVAGSSWRGRISTVLFAASPITPKCRSSCSLPSFSLSPDEAKRVRGPQRTAVPTATTGSKLQTARQRLVDASQR